MRGKSVALVLGGALALSLTCGLGGPAPAQKQAEVIPHNQDRPPGPPLSPREAMKRMQVPPGFHVELVAAELRRRAGYPKRPPRAAAAGDDQGRRVARS